MSTCPNKNNADWKKMVETVGEEKAYDIYTNLHENIPILGITQNGKPSNLYSDLVKNNAKTANKLWYKSLTPFETKKDYERDINGEPTLDSYIETTPIKSVEYTSSVNESINSVINSADVFIKKTLLNFSNRMLAHPSPKVANVVTDLQYYDVNRDIVDLDLANLAKALTSVLKYNTYTLSHEATVYNKGGLVEQLDHYINSDMNSILSNPKSKNDFWKFMGYAKTFIDGYTTVDLLQSIDKGEFAEEEKVINDIIKELQKQSPEINNISAKYDQLLKNGQELSVLPFTSNPEIINGLRELFDATDDENMLQLYFNAMGDTNVPFIANLIKKYSLTATNSQTEYIKEQKAFADLLRNTFNIKDPSQLTAKHFDKYLDKDENGNPNMHLKQKYNWTKFENAKVAYFADIASLYRTDRNAYIKMSSKWYAEHEKTVVSEEDIKNIIAQKKEELPTIEFNKWLYRNIRKNEDGTLTVKMGDHIFKEPSDMYLNSDYAAIENDPLFKYMNNIIAKMGSYIGRENIFNNGYLPSLTEQEKQNKTLIEKGEAWINAQAAHRKSKVFIGENDQMIRILTVPMIQRYSIADTIKIRDKRFGEDYDDYQNSVLDEVSAAGKGEFKSIKEIREFNRESKRKNDEYNSGKQNYNLYEVLNDFIKEATIYKHRSDMKYETDLALHQISNMQFNKRSGTNKLLTNSNASKIANKRITQTVNGKDSNLYKHFDEWLDAVFYENFDIDEGMRTKLTNVLMKYVSSKNMWFNVTAGISNVAYNRAQIRAEAAGGYYYDRNDLFATDKMYSAALIDIMGNNGKEERETLVGAIIKLFDITQNTNEKDYESGQMWKKLMSSDTLYVLNNTGEHYSQNVPLLAMLRSHRILNGKIVGYNEFRYNNYRDALNNILSEKQKSELSTYWKLRYENEDFKDSKKDYLRDYILTLTKDQQREFIKERKKIDDISKTEFEKFPRALDAFSLENGVAVLKDEIEMNGIKYNTKLSEFAFADFKEMVKIVNQRNNGVYNKEDAAIVSRRAYGKVLLQFRKWMIPAWNKRFGSKFGKSYWNERRKEWEKGSYISLLQFLGTPYKADPMANVEEGKMFYNFMTRIVQGTVNLSKNIGIYWKTLDDFEKSNVKCAVGELSYLTAILVVAAILKGLKPDDDDDDKFAYNLAVYQTDRLMSDLMFFTPVGLVNESAKVMKSPVAVQGAILDVAKFMGSAIRYPFQDEQSRIYQTGVYKDEYKIKSNFIKLVPVANKWQQLNKINRFNKYYILFRG